MNQLLSIVDDKIVIEKLRVTHLEGPILHSGNLTVVGTSTFNDTVSFDKNLLVKGVAEVDTLKVKNLITDDAKQFDAYTFSAADQADLEGKGLVWQDPAAIHQFVFKTGPNRIWSTESIDLYKNASYKIGGADVLQMDRLGQTVVSSNLRSVGVLDSLRVRGEVSLGETAFVKSSIGRFGINTETPNGALSVVDNLVEVVVSSYKENQAYIGTWSNNTLNIGTDNTPRITLSGTTVSIGSAKSQNATVKINGLLEVNKLKVDELVADTRIERTTPIEFQATDAESIYGKGLLWKGAGITRQLIMLPGPDRIQSTEHFSLNNDKEFIIGGDTVLTRTSLGPSVTGSALTSVGTLTSLAVEGPVNLANVLTIDNNQLYIKTQLTVGENNTTTLTDTNIKSNSESFGIEIKGTTEFSVSSSGNIQLGDKENTGRVINAYGKLAVNVSNPREDSDLEVNGTVVINGRKQTHGDSIPVDGQWIKGDIVWNTDPKETDYIGWVCVLSGTPGTWKSFGYISER